MVISCALTPRTIAGRIDAIPNEGDNETNTNLNLNLNNNNNSDSFDTNNKSLINKLVEIKEKYNKLMNEKYELEKEKNTKKNKIKKLKRTH